MKLIAKAVVATAFAVAYWGGLTARGAEAGSSILTIRDEVSASAPVEVISDQGAATDDCTCPACCEESCLPTCEGCPGLVGSVAWVYMWRDKPDNTDLLFGRNRSVLLNGRDFNPEPTPGIDASVIYYRTCETGFEGRYLWLDDQSDEVTVDIPFASSRTNGIPRGLGALLIDYTYQSKLQTAELNLRRKHGNFDLIFGFRYVDFRETLLGSYQLSNLSFGEGWGTYNNLYGFQTGVDALFWESAGGKVRLNGFGKAGIYYNKMETHLEMNVFQAVGIPLVLSSSTSKGAFLGELGVNAAYQINSHLALRAGYEILWLSGVATAGRQASGTFGNGLQGMNLDVNGNSSVLYHGANAGLEVSW